jgi:hypothetical protein
VIGATRRGDFFGAGRQAGSNELDRVERASAASERTRSKP